MKASELILNTDGSVYHLKVRPDEVAPLIIFVGDQDRVELVSQHFDRVDLKRQCREFVTHTGWLGNKRITVLSTGIGTDNIDIVLNELDALFNIDFTTRKVKEQLTSLDIIRIGTSGSIHPDILVDDILVSTWAVGTDNLGEYYPAEKAEHPLLPAWAYVTRRHAYDLDSFPGPLKEGITLTCSGFYGPQGRVLRITPQYTIPLDELYRQTWKHLPFTNLEMETSGIYLLSSLLQHRAISFNAILANRIRGTFSSDSSKTVADLIRHTLTWLNDLP